MRKQTQHQEQKMGAGGFSRRRPSFGAASGRPLLILLSGLTFFYIFSFFDFFYFSILLINVPWMAQNHDLTL